MTERLYTVAATEWSPGCTAPDAAQATLALENGRVLYLPRLAFRLSINERRFLSPRFSDGKTKNISYDPSSGGLRHTATAGADRTALARMMARYADAAHALITGLCPTYARDLAWALTSYRPFSATGRQTSPRKDDTRLHIDAFASRPVRGQRILRVFCNINPDGVPRVWNLGEPFEAMAARYATTVPAQLPGSAWLLEKLHVTKGRRSAYDHLMLSLHDRAKLDDDYQRSSSAVRIEFPSNSTWIVFTDLVMHAALAGQYLLEQTFYLPTANMMDETLAPLRKLENLCHRPLA